ncbi:MAG: DUF3256 family protein [Bacteroidales bacterium]|nr:DUF3256 family protein [Bacteroidales bacterium]
MKRYIILLLLSSISFLSSGQTINELFKSMPSEYLPAFSEANKTMLLVDSSLSVIPYALGEIERLEYTDTFLSLKTSEVGTMQIKILPLVNNTQIVALIKTVCSSNVCDSDIQFLTNEWEEIQKNNILPTIPPSIFFDETKTDTPGFKWSVSQIDIYPLQLQFKDGSNDLQVTFNIKKHLSKQDALKIETYLAKESIDLTWNKSTFVY